MLLEKLIGLNKVDSGSKLRREGMELPLYGKDDRNQKIKVSGIPWLRMKANGYPTNDEIPTPLCFERRQ
jgi:hypothetical protein